MTRFADIMSVSALKRRLGHSRGFTLVELLVAMGLMMLVMLAIFTVWFGLQRTYGFTEDDMKAQQEARAALNEIVEFVRTARQPTSPPSEALDAVIVRADRNELVCWTDVDRDTAHDLELVRFRVDSDPSARTLYRDTSETGDINFASGGSVRLVGRWLSNTALVPLFTYRDAAGEVLTPPLSAADLRQLRTIEIDLRIDVETGKSPIEHQLTSVVHPRNLNY